MDEQKELVSTEYITPEPGVITGSIARQIPIAGRIALTAGEIGACFALVGVIILLFLLTGFMGFDGLWLVARMFFLGGVAALGRMVVFDKPGGMKYGDWLLMWWGYRTKRRNGRLTYHRPLRTRATVRRRVQPTELKPEPATPYRAAGATAAPNPSQAGRPQ